MMMIINGRLSSGVVVLGMAGNVDGVVNIDDLGGFNQVRSQLESGRESIPPPTTMNSPRPLFSLLPFPPLPCAAPHHP